MTPYFEQGDIVLYHADCREVFRRFTGVTDLVLTDPPYRFGIRRSKSETKLSASFAKIKAAGTNEGFDSAILSEFRNWMCFCSKLQMQELLMLASKTGLYQLLMWHKTNHNPLLSGCYLPDTEYIIHKFEKRCDVHGSDRKTHVLLKREMRKFGHPNVKPEPVIAKLMENGSAEGGSVLDLYAGSGTVGVVAKKLNRRAILIEINEGYCEIAAKRIESTAKF